MSERTMKARRDISLEDAKRLCLEMIRPGEVDGMPSANDAAIRVVLEALAGAEQSLRLATNLTVPASEHQRLQAEAAASVAVVRDLLGHEIRDLLERTYRMKDHACAECVPGGPLTGGGFRCALHRAEALVANPSSAGSALLAEMEWLRKEVEHLENKRDIARSDAEREREMVRKTESILASVRENLNAEIRDLRSRLEEVDADRKDILAERGQYVNENFSLRSRLETVERERDEARKDAGNHAVAGRLLRESLAAKESHLAQAREALEWKDGAIKHVLDALDEGEDISTDQLRAALALSPPSPGAETKKRCASTYDGYQCDRPAGHETDEDNREHSARIEALTYCWSGPGDASPTLCQTCLEPLVNGRCPHQTEHDTFPAPSGSGVEREEPKCARCDGEGKIANSEEGEPWSAWANLPPGADLAVRIGAVKPIDCSACGGSGKDGAK